MIAPQPLGPPARPSPPHTRRHARSRVTLMRPSAETAMASEIECAKIIAHGARPRLNALEPVPSLPVAGTSRGCTFSPPAICGFDGVNSSRVLPLTHERAGTGESVLQVVGPTERDVEEGIAKIGPFGSVFAAEGRMLGVGSRHHHCIRTSETRDEYP